MALANSESSFGTITKLFHWVTACLIILAIILGVVASRWDYSTSDALAQKAWLFSLHKTVGVTTFFVALLRILWATCQKRPGLLNGDKPVESFLAETVHWALYISLVMVPLAGWITHASSEGFAPLWGPFGQSLPLIPKSPELSEFAGILHTWWEKILLGAILLHVAGALKHHFVDRDATLRRMWFGASTSRTIKHRHSYAPIIVAVSVFVMVAGAGFTKFLGKGAGDALGTLVAEAPASEWTVKDGQLTITVQQFGSAVRGEFAEWTADISFDPQITNGVAGQVSGDIIIGSLSLGSVTAEAMGANYFNRDAFPTAQYAGEITHGGDDYVLNGTVTIRDSTQPFSMPFALDLTDGVATVQGDLVLNRMDFGIGADQTDEGSLGFGVSVSLNLTAERSN